MKLASYKGLQEGFMRRLGNRITKIRLRGKYSHTEIVFEPGDGVDHLMPDGTCEPDENGALWCLSSVAMEKLPEFSTRRAGSSGGVRFKRITLDESKWDLVDLDKFDAKSAAVFGVINQGALYDWQMILGFVSWVIPEKDSRFTCAEFCADALHFEEAERFDPCNFHEVIRRINEL